ncbi:OsmC family protein [Rugosimonospora acidiphila]|uniref:OsmC family protein n=1 Tax=Rugosimonospora acidiphila TaxID=556531 RepID=UPI0031EC6DDD
MGRTHSYELTVTWTGDRGSGTSGYRDYDRTNEVTAPGLPTLAGSSDPTFRGDRDRWNPEQLLVAALAQCHLLAYLHACVNAGVVVVGYTDTPLGQMVETPDGAGHFTEVLLRPQVTVADAAMAQRAAEAHETAHRLCFIANSVNFPVRHEPTTLVTTAVATD